MLTRLIRRWRTGPLETDPYLLAVQMQEAQEAMVEQIVARELAPLIARIEALEAQHTSTLEHHLGERTDRP